MISFLQSTPSAIQIGLLVLRVGIGLIYMAHGYPKLMGGVATWQWCGQQMALFGIHFLPVFWGLCAALAEFLGGFALALGLCTRFAAALLLCVMVVALAYHLHNKDSFAVYSHPLTLLVVFTSFIIMGGGNYSFDTVLLFNK
ncbi:MAG: DoxX family protein [Candidatus Babeliales bacterium]